MRTDGDYISREAALNLIDRYWQQAYNAHFLDAAVRLGSVYREMEDIPAADVREVVLCRDCKYYRQDAELADGKGLVREWYCPIHEAEFAEDAFCSYGRLDAERRSGSCMTNW